MKKIFLFILTTVLFFCCQDDEKIIFNADISEVEFSSSPFNGGVTLYYKLPQKTDIFFVMAKYLNYRGEEVTKKASYGTDSLVLDGFTEAKENFSANIYLVDKFGNLSKPIVKEFSTLANETISVFDNMKVSSSWQGFRVSYEGSPYAKGFVNIGYEGINPKTQKLDTLLVGTYPIKGGGIFTYDRLTDPDILNATVSVWTTDYKGNEIKRVTHNDVEVYQVALFDSNNIGFEGSSVEDETTKTSWKYLFDGDKTGITAFMNSIYSNERYCFVSEKYVVDDPSRNVWTLDLKEPQMIAAFRMYSFLNAQRTDLIYRSGIRSMRVGSSSLKAINSENPPTVRYPLNLSVPNNFEVYGTNDPSASIEECDLLGSFMQQNYNDLALRWYAPGIDPEKKFTKDDVEAFKNADPNYISIVLPVTENKYRYLKLKVISTFHRISWDGSFLDNDGSFYAEEIEVYVKKD